MTVAQGTERGPAESNTPSVDPLDDVFGSAPASPSLDAEAPTSTPSILDPSDIPRLRSTHVTSGYREGIAASKEQHIQAGFDEGYSLGAEIGMKVGWCLGALEGMLRALPTHAVEDHDGDVGAADAVAQARTKKEEVKQMLREAENELEMERLFGREYFGEDGIWLYQVQDHEGEDEVTFAEVAVGHPVVRKWVGAARGLADRLGLKLE